MKTEDEIIDLLAQEKAKNILLTQRIEKLQAEIQTRIETYYYDIKVPRNALCRKIMEKLGNAENFDSNFVKSIISEVLL